MQSIWSLIYQELSYFVQEHRARIIHTLKCALVVIMLAFLCEVFLFNMNFWMTRGLNTVNLADKITLTKTPDKTFRLTSLDHVLEFQYLNKEIKNIRLDFDESEPAQNVEVKVSFTDEAHQTYFNSTDYAVGIPVRTVATNMANTEYLKLSTTGIVQNLRIEVTGKDISYPITLKGLYLNAQYPFEFSRLRFWIAVFIFALTYAFRPKSSIYKWLIIEHPILSRASVVACALIEIYLMSIFLFFGSNNVGIATEHYNSGSWDKKSIINSFEVGGENAQQYAELAKAFTEGHLYLDIEPPEWLVNMDNPYDMGARDELQKGSDEQYLWDTAYYDGHYYVYFGVLPVLVFYLPFYLIFHGAFPTALGVWLCAGLFIVGSTLLLDRFARHHFKRVSLGLYLLLQIPLVVCTGGLYLIKFPTFYSLPIMMGLALSVWGLYLWMRGRRDERPCGWYLAGSLCMALVVACRPQLIMLSLVAFPLFWRQYISSGAIRTRKGMTEVACLLLPYIIVAAGIMWYNKARFGSVTDFGSNYNLTTNDMTRRGWDLGRIPPAIFSYFFQPPNIVGVFPFVQPTDFQTTYMGQTVKEATFGGIFACLPILWLLPFTSLALKARLSSRHTRTVFGVVVVLIVSGVVIALADAEMAGILQRYYADFSLMFVMVAILVAFMANERMNHARNSYALGVRVLLALVSISVLFSVCMAAAPETNWYSDVYSWAYESLLRIFQFWT